MEIIQDFFKESSVCPKYWFSINRNIILHRFM